ncbi:MAG TPA: hypothetical protein VJS30_04340 [Paraburkholderia sp.]|nr:hypothetical protein [Paraburkholderia sp.]
MKKIGVSRRMGGSVWTAFRPDASTSRAGRALWGAWSARLARLSLVFQAGGAESRYNLYNLAPLMVEPFRAQCQ